MDIGAQLRDARLAAGLSQTELARRTGVPSTVLSAYENNRREPGASTYLRLLAATGAVPKWRRLPDEVACGSRLAQVLSLAEAMPHRARPLATARAPWTA